jgi:antitoxin (DNA-binding transcriptional repressor) of toxin-antitoxin stability system
MTVSVEQAKRELERLIERAALGEKVLLALNGKVVAQILAVVDGEVVRPTSSSDS